MTTAELTLFDAPAAESPPQRPRGRQPTITADAGRGEDEPPPFDPSRWVMSGWRDARDVAFTPEQILTVLINTPRGPCARCGATHHRYGDGGQPLCFACRTPSTTEERSACTTNTANRPKT